MPSLNKSNGKGKGKKDILSPSTSSEDKNYKKITIGLLRRVKRLKRQRAGAKGAISQLRSQLVSITTLFRQSNATSETALNNFMDALNRWPMFLGCTKIVNKNKACSCRACNSEAGPSTSTPEEPGTEAAAVGEGLFDSDSEYEQQYSASEDSDDHSSDFESYEENSEVDAPVLGGVSSPPRGPPSSPRYTPLTPPGRPSSPRRPLPIFNNHSLYTPSTPPGRPPSPHPLLATSSAYHSLYTPSTPPGSPPLPRPLPISNYYSPSTPTLPIRPRRRATARPRGRQLVPRVSEAEFRVETEEESGSDSDLASISNSDLNNSNSDYSETNSLYWSSSSDSDSDGEDDNAARVLRSRAVSDSELPSNNTRYPLRRRQQPIDGRREFLQRCLTVAEARRSVTLSNGSTEVHSIPDEEPIYDGEPLEPLSVRPLPSSPSTQNVDNISDEEPLEPVFLPSPISSPSRPSPSSPSTQNVDSDLIKERLQRCLAAAEFRRQRSEEPYVPSAELVPSTSSVAVSSSPTYTPTPISVLRTILPVPEANTVIETVPVDTAIEAVPVPVDEPLSDSDTVSVLVIDEQIICPLSVRATEPESQQSQIFTDPFLNTEVHVDSDESDTDAYSDSEDTTETQAAILDAETQAAVAAVINLDSATPAPQTQDSMDLVFTDSEIIPRTPASAIMRDLWDNYTNEINSAIAANNNSTEHQDDESYIMDIIDRADFVTDNVLVVALGLDSEPGEPPIVSEPEIAQPESNQEPETLVAPMVESESESEVVVVPIDLTGDSENTEAIEEESLTLPDLPEVVTEEEVVEEEEPLPEVIVIPSDNNEDGERVLVPKLKLRKRRLQRTEEKDFRSEESKKRKTLYEIGPDRPYANKPDMCEICYTANVDFVINPCKHTLCFRCYMTMRETTYDPKEIAANPDIVYEFKCPVCRKRINDFYCIDRQLKKRSAKKEKKDKKDKKRSRRRERRERKERSERE